MNPTTKGMTAMVGATVIWGFSALYYKLIAHVPPLEVLAHRTLWSLVFFAVVLALRGRLGELIRLIAAPRSLGMKTIEAVNDLEVVDQLVYVLDRDGLKILEFSDPGGRWVLRHTITEQRVQWAPALGVADGRAFVAASGDFIEYDVSNPSQPRRTAWLRGQTRWVESILVVTKLSTVLNSYGSVEEAIASFG